MKEVNLKERKVLMCKIYILTNKDTNEQTYFTNIQKVTEEYKKLTKENPNIELTVISKSPDYKHSKVYSENVII